MGVDDKYVTLEAKVFGADDITGITFTSSDPETVSVSEPEIEDNYAEITLTALKPGKATITVAFGGQTATCQVIVTGDASVGSIDADALAIRYADGVVTAGRRCTHRRILHYGRARWLGSCRPSERRRKRSAHRCGYRCRRQPHNQQDYCKIAF